MNAQEKEYFFDYGSDLPGNGNIFIDYNYKDGAGNNSGIFSSNFSIWISNVLSVSYTHLRAHETRSNLVCRLLLEKIFF